MIETHETYMELAIREAEGAAAMDEVPVGAVLVDAVGNILAASGNRVITLGDPTAHAEILVLRKAAEALSNYRLIDTTLYVTVEPCPMCMGALIHARVSRIVFGTEDPKWGAAGSLYNLAADSRLNHHPDIVPGISREPCRRLMQTFFRARRKSVATPPDLT